MTRPSWDEHWLKAADLSAEMSTCASGRSVGAVAVQDRRIVASGFNGVPAKIAHPTVCLRREYNIPSGEQPHLCGCQHAEANCVANAARHGASLLEATIYVTCQPCMTCMGMLANVGIRRVVFRGAYPDSRSLDLAAEVGIRVDQLP